MTLQTLNAQISLQRSLIEDFELAFYMNIFTKVFDESIIINLRKNFFKLTHNRKKEEKKHNQTLWNAPSLIAKEKLKIKAFEWRNFKTQEKQYKLQDKVIQSGTIV